MPTPTRDDNWFRTTGLATGVASHGRILDCSYCEPKPPEPWVPPALQPVFDGSPVVLGFVAGTTPRPGCSGVMVSGFEIEGAGIEFGSWLEAPSPESAYSGMYQIIRACSCVGVWTALDVPGSGEFYHNGLIEVFDSAGQSVWSGALSDAYGPDTLYAEQEGACVEFEPGQIYYVAITPPTP